MGRKRDDSPSPSRKRLCTERTEIDKVASSTQEPLFSQETNCSQENGIGKELGNAGTIERLLVRNFMCHDSLEINFNQNVNFIVGRNGSGKSAILLALVVGLAGRASVTNRGNSIKSFIKSGENFAVIEITLRNEGVYSFKPDIYGKRITIIRNFSAGGSSSYKIKNGLGRIVGTGAKEVSRLCMALDIQIDNPVCILNQDMSRNFLNSSDGKKLYILFARATFLESIEEINKKLLIDKRTAKQIIASKQKEFEELEKVKKKWESKYNLIKSAGTFANRLVDLKRETYWANYYKIESEKTTVESNIVKIEEKVKVIEEKLATNKEQHKEFKEQHNDLNRQESEIRRENEGLEKQYKDVKMAIQKIKESNQDKFTELSSNTNLINRKSSEINNLQKEIERIKKTMDNHLAERQSKLEEIELLQKREIDSKAMFESASHELDQKQKSVSLAQQTTQKIQNDVRNLNEQISSKQLQIKALRNKHSNILSLYGENIPRINEEIKANRSLFTELPRGPLGCYIELKDKNWAKAVEESLGRDFLRSFCVTNHKDLLVLNKIFSKIQNKQPKPSIICSKFIHKVHDVSRTCVIPPSDCVALRDVLVIKDPIIENCLIDEKRIENTLLIPSEASAHRHLSAQENVPRNCAIGLTMAGDLYYPAPNYRTYAGQYNSVQLLQSSVDDALAQFKYDLTNLEAELALANTRLAAAKEAEQGQVIELRNQEKHTAKLRSVVSDIGVKLRMTKNQRDMLAQPGCVETLEKQLQEMKEDLEKLETLKVSLDRQVEELNRKIEEQKSKADEIKRLMITVEERASPFLAKKTKIDNKAKELLIESQRHSSKLTDLNDNLKELQEQLTQIVTRLENHSANSDEFEPRVSNPRSQKVIEAEQKNVEQEIRNIEARAEDAELIERMFKECERKYTSSQEALSKLKPALKDVLNSVDVRRRSFDKLIKKTTQRVTDFFRIVLELRKYKGSLKIDHDEKQLEISIQKENTTGGALTDTRSLSGGERSYATVAFVTALWKYAEFPFYFLDEFDVFMDKVNRRIVMDLLMQHAEAHPEKQYVFLTPLDICDIQSSSTIMIHRMPDPREDE